MRAEKRGIKRSFALLLAVAVLFGVVLFGIAAAPVQAPPVPGTSAASGITLSSSVQISFPASMTFSIKAASDANIVKLRLHYNVTRQNVAQVSSEGWAQFTPANSVTTQWTWDMRKSGLPPGARAVETRRSQPGNRAVTALG